MQIPLLDECVKVCDLLFFLNDVLVLSQRIRYSTYVLRPFLDLCAVSGFSSVLLHTFNWLIDI